MDVFRLDDWLIDQYEAFSRSFVQIGSEEIRRKVDAGYAERRFWPVSFPGYARRGWIPWSL